MLRFCGTSLKLPLKRDVKGWLVGGLYPWEIRGHLTTSAWNRYKSGKIVAGKDVQKKKKAENQFVLLQSEQWIHNQCN